MEEAAAFFGRRQRSEKQPGRAVDVSATADLRQLERLARRLTRDHMRRIRARVGRTAVQVARMELDRAGDNDPATGKPWAAQKRPLGHSVLRQTGAMLAARIVRYKRQGEYVVKVFFTARKSFKSKRFWVHQKGWRKRGMPARPHIGFSGMAEDAIQHAVNATVQQGMKE